MKLRVQQVGMIWLAIAIVCLTVSCNTSSPKVAQCTDLIKVVNQTVLDSKTITESGTNGDISRIEKMVGIFEKAATDLAQVKVTDDKLKAYQSQFLTMYRGVTEINKQIVTSIKDKKSTQVYQGLNKYRNIVSPEKDLATGLTQYCQPPKKK
jgi:hypothetical protein